MFKEGAVPGRVDAEMYSEEAETERVTSGIQSQQVEEEHQFVVPQFPVQFRVSLCRS
jgi:hypothetical protein